MSYYGYKTSDFYSLKWVRIFHHDSYYGYFNNIGDTLISPKNKHRFSVLGALSRDFKINDAYEFVLEYPLENEKLHWKQAANPIDSSENLGYTPIDIPTKFWNFAGLLRSADINHTLLDGTLGGKSDWWYSVGTIRDMYKPNVPFYYISDQLFFTHLVNLWLRIDSIDDIKKLPTLSYFRCTCRHGKSIISLFIYVILVVNK